MGICGWLYKADPRWLDLDALLSVELPPVFIAREKTQLISACLVSCSKADGMNADYVIKNSSVSYLTPVLDNAVFGVIWGLSVGYNVGYDKNLVKNTGATRKHNPLISLMERAAGFEPVTLGLGSRCSTS